MADIKYAPFCRIDSELLRNQLPESEEAITERLSRINEEFVEAFALLRKYRLSATIYGSARSLADSAIAGEAYKLGGLLAKSNFVVMTGGGGGVMEAANKGAKDAGGQSVGLNIELPEEQRPNGHTTDAMTFHYFFTRKVALAYAAEVYIFFPGGFGTLDEFFEIVTLVQTGKIGCIPVILVGEEYWSPLLRWFDTVLCEIGTINTADRGIYRLVKDADEAHALICSLLDVKP